MTTAEESQLAGGVITRRRASLLPRVHCGMELPGGARCNGFIQRSPDVEVMQHGETPIIAALFSSDAYARIRLRASSKSRDAGASSHSIRPSE